LPHQIRQIKEEKNPKNSKNKTYKKFKKKDENRLLLLLLHCRAVSRCVSRPKT
jgi:hypothetical protein